MKLCSLALDYDGTIARNDRLDPAVRDAIALARTRGIFSRWIRDVFGDHALAAELRTIESGHRGRPSPHTIPELIDAVRARYDLQDDVLAATA